MVDLSRWYGFTVLHSMVDLSSSQTLNVITRWDMVYLLIAWWIFLDGMGLPIHSMVDLSSSQTLNVITRWDMVYLLIAWWIFLDGMGLPFFIAWWIFPVRKPGPVKDQLVGGSLRRISVSAT